MPLKNPKSINKKKIAYQIIKEKKIINYLKLLLIKFLKKKIEECKRKFQNILKSFTDKNLNIAGYGAAAKTTTLLHYFELNNNEHIKLVFDDNPLKQKLYLPGTKIKVEDPQYLKTKKIEILIIFAWNYSEAIIKKLKKYKFTRNKNFKFLIPFPKPKIL